MNFCCKVWMMLCLIIPEKSNWWFAVWEGVWSSWPPRKGVLCIDLQGWPWSEWDTGETSLWTTGSQFDIICSFIMVLEVIWQHFLYSMLSICQAVLLSKILANSMQWFLMSLVSIYFLFKIYVCMCQAKSIIKKLFTVQ